MKKLILQMHMTMDGFVAGPNCELDWMEADQTVTPTERPIRKYGYNFTGSKNDRRFYNLLGKRG